MVDLKYRKYIMKDLVLQNLDPRTPAEILLERDPNDTAEWVYMQGAQVNNGISLCIAWHYETTPKTVEAEAMVHEHDQYLVFVGGDPEHMEDFGGSEVEMYIGEEGEKFLINEPTVVYTPKGLVHDPLTFKPDKSFMTLDLSTTSKWKKKDIETSGEIFPTTASKYKKYLTKIHAKIHTLGVKHYIDNQLIGEVKKTIKTLSYKGKGAERDNLNMNWSIIKEPLTIFEPPHTHDFDQFILFLGSNPEKISEFDAEAEIWLGKENEKHVIDSTTIVYIPKGLMHHQINLKRIGRPIMLVNLFFSPEFKKAQTLP